MPNQGSTIRFWEQNWGMGLLKNRFDELYTFSIQQESNLQQALQMPDMIRQFRTNLSDQASRQLTTLQQEINRYRSQQHSVPESATDTVLWTVTENGVFTVRSEYQAMLNGPRIRTTAHKIWKLRNPPRYRIFGWVLIHNKILTTHNLKKRGFQIAGICYLCWNQDETSQHMFNECPQTIPIYRGVLHRGEGYTAGQNNINKMTDKNTPKTDKELILIANFTIWRERCNRIFKEERKSTQQLIDEAIDQWKASTAQARDRNFMLREV